MSVVPGTAVRSVDNPGREGVITNSPARQKPSGLHYQVRWTDGDFDFVHVDEIEPLDNLDLQDPYALVAQGRYGRAQDLRRNLTYVHLSGRLANLVYSMGITNTDFYAHQYRPLLTLLDSPVNGLLIADEVGLGKTIEAGLIWTELRARFDLRRLVVVCPAMLREKWRSELNNRFGIEAQIVNASELLDAMKQPRRAAGEGRAWIISYQAARPARDWRPRSKNAPKKKNARWQLADYFFEHGEDEPLIDLVVFDEAHYMRNSDTAAWRLGDLLRAVSDYQVMLSATPINLHNKDLYNLLHLLDPEHFSSEHDFSALVKSNKPLVAARNAVLNYRSTAAEIRGHLEVAREDTLIGGSHQLAAILKEPPTDGLLESKEYRAELADALERINLLSHVITRTRKRDVQERRVQRNVVREPVKMSEDERKLYTAITEATRQYALERGINDGFLLATPQRQVTSCPAAIAEAWLGGGKDVDDLIEDLESEYEDELELSETDDCRWSLKETLMAIVPRQVDLAGLRQNDTKFQRLLEVAGEHLEANPSEKIIVFTTFRTTARYLVRRLHERGFPARLVWGNQQQTKQEVIDEFRESPTDRFLISTEVASEGVDLQFCRVVVNYDLPWNPTRIEQRIGRIDRLGQKADIIHIWNLYFEGSIDDRIVNRLLARLRIFEEALGESEAIVGDQIRRLESELLSRPLTPEEEEARIEAAALALENLRVHREELERNAAHMMAHGQRIIERIDAARELAHRITERDLFVYVLDYLTTYVQGHRFDQVDSDPLKIRISLPGECAAKLDDFLRKEGLQGLTQLASGQERQCRFLNRISAVPEHGEEVIHQFHPLIRFISADLKARNAHYYPLVSVRLHIGDKQHNMDPGVYVFYVRSWSFIGVREEELLAVSVMRLDGNHPMDSEQSDAILQLSRIDGRDWIGAEQVIDATRVHECLEVLETDLDTRYRLALDKKKNENTDRANFQLSSIDRYLERRLPTLRQTLHAHIAANRGSLAKATQAQIDKLTTRMSVRRERILEQAKVRSEKRFVCAGVINVQ